MAFLAVRPATPLRAGNRPDPVSTSPSTPTTPVVRTARTSSRSRSKVALSASGSAGRTGAARQTSSQCGAAAADAVTTIAAAAATAESRSMYRLLVGMEPLLKGSMAGYLEALNRNAGYAAGTAAFTSV
ncbi:hypothetical protein GCM10022419_095710 [Nonomuraea rosea]|uniref:Uncharacterized protein n=1 Tax=Nonomuraea rosea TaxID=638574 RepID=A0ABP6Z3U4_9ACTN